MTRTRRSERYSITSTPMPTDPPTITVGEIVNGLQEELKIQDADRQRNKPASGMTKLDEFFLRIYSSRQGELIPGEAARKAKEEAILCLQTLYGDHA